MIKTSQRKLSLSILTWANGHLKERKKVTQMWTYPNTGDPRYKGRKTAKLYEQKTIATSAACNYNKIHEKSFCEFG